MDILTALAAFLLMISIIVVIHEWGHYRVARCFGLIGTQFSVGFGKKLFSWTDRRGTEWRVSPILLGGYVKFAEDADNPKGLNTLDSLPRWQRALVVAAGPVINLLFAAALLAAIAYAYGYPTGRPVVQAIVEGSPAAQADIEIGDRILAFNGQRVVHAAQVTQRIMLNPDQDVTLDIERDQQVRQVEVMLGRRPIDDGLGNRGEIGFLGINMPKAFEKAPTVSAAITQGIADGMFTTYAQLTSLKQIVTGDRQITELSGPIRIAKMSSHTLRLGLMPFLYLMAMISIAVGIMNLLPIPGLDGGHLATYAVEGALQRDLPPQLAKSLVQIGFVIIAGLGVLGITLDFIALA